MFQLKYKIIGHFRVIILVSSSKNQIIWRINIQLRHEKHFLKNSKITQRHFNRNDHLMLETIFLILFSEGLEIIPLKINFSIFFLIILEQFICICLTVNLSGSHKQHLLNVPLYVIDWCSSQNVSRVFKILFF